VLGQGGHLEYRDRSAHKKLVAEREAGKELGRGKSSE